MAREKVGKSFFEKVKKSLALSENEPYICTRKFLKISFRCGGER